MRKIKLLTYTAWELIFFTTGLSFDLDSFLIFGLDSFLIFGLGSCLILLNNNCAFLCVCVWCLYASILLSIGSISYHHIFCYSLKIQKVILSTILFAENVKRQDNLKPMDKLFNSFLVPMVNDNKTF